MRKGKSQKKRSCKKIIANYLSPKTDTEREEIVVEPSFDDMVRILTAYDSHQGTREYQQDALFVSEPVCVRCGEEVKVFAILCDGMGGMQNGEKASNLVVTEMRNELEAIRFDHDVATFMIDKIKTLDVMIASIYGDSATGTTMVAAVILGNRLFWGAVGDSRIYLIRREEIEQVTRDHNYYLNLKEDVEKGKITQAEADTHPMREALISFIGSGHTDIIDANTEPFRLAHGDIVLLCSDGLSKSLNNDEIRDIISEHRDNLGEAARSLTLGAIEIDMGPKDNTSVILIQYYEEKKE